MRRPFFRAVTVVAVVAIGVVGALHLPAARPLLAWLGVPCPVRSVSATDVEALHGAALATLRGNQPAPTRAVFGLTLLTSRLDDGRAWARARGLMCEEQVRGLTYLSCTQVDAARAGLGAAGADVQDLTLVFDGVQRLIGVDLLRGGLSPEAAAAAGLEVAARLRQTLGAPSERAGVFDDEPAGPGFQTSTLRYRFSDSLVSLTVARIPGRGVALREQYVGIPLVRAAS